MKRSAQRLFWLASSPSGTPRVSDTAMPASASGRSMRAPASTRRKTSRPRLSVPNQNVPGEARLGRCAFASSTGLYGTA